MNLTFRLVSNQKNCNEPEVTQCLLQKYRKEMQQQQCDLEVGDNFKVRIV